MGINYAHITENMIKEFKKENREPSLLLHSCCAPCSSSVIEFLSQYFKVTVFYYNPNIMNESEYIIRKEEQIKFIENFKTKNPVEFMEGPYDVASFLEFAKPLAQEREGGERCFHCYRLRMEKTAQTAVDKGFELFTTTLTVSPLKNSTKINEIGRSIEEKYRVPFLYSDFKKKDGYKRSVELSRIHELYRQNYCGCEFSK